MKADRYLFQMACATFPQNEPKRVKNPSKVEILHFWTIFYRFFVSFGRFTIFKFKKYLRDEKRLTLRYVLKKKIIKKYSFLTKWRQKGRNRPKWAPRNVKCHKMTKNNPIMLKFSQNVQFSYIFHCTKFEIISMTLNDVK